MTPAPYPCGEIGLADALIALDGLDPAQEEAARAWLPELLGIDLPVHRPATARSAGSTSADPTEGDPVAAALRDQTARRQSDHAASPDDDHPYPRQEDAPTLPAELAWEEDPTDPSRDWYHDAVPLPPARELALDDLPPLQPLFEPRRNRSVLSGALATSQRDGDLDLDAIVQSVTNRQPLCSLPRLPIPTTRLGLQLLIDRGPGLLPYHRDQDFLAQAIAQIVSRDRTEILRFSASPLRGVGTGPLLLCTNSYHPPAPGVPVVLLSDLGLCRQRDPATGARTAEWLRFVQRVRAAGCPLLAIVPATAERISPLLRPHFRVLPWSRTTTIATVRSIVGRGLSTPA